jgi:hypothetical protein
MSHFAKVENGIVTQVIVADQEFIDSGVVGDGWIKTSYNTHGNKHALGGTPLRGNYAGIGFIYDAENDVFYVPAPYPSWILDKNTWTWSSPVPYPKDGKLYEWNETITNWVAITFEGATPVETMP